MAHPGSVCGIAVNALTVSWNQNECSIPSARSNSFCASGVHEVLNSTWPSFSFFCWASSWPSAAADANANSDATTAEMSLGFMDAPPREDEKHYTLESGAPGANRTRDLWLRRPSLYPLSYGRGGSEKLYTARSSGRRRVGDGRQMVLDEAHRLADRRRHAQPALHARPQHAVGAEALDHRDERLPEAVACAQDHRLVLQAEVVHREHLEQLVESADPPGQRDKQVRRFRHQLLALGERLDDLERAEIGRGALRTDEMARHDPEHLSARRGRRSRCNSHKPPAAPAVYELQSALRASSAEFRGEIARGGREILDRRAEQAHRVFCHVRP